MEHLETDEIARYLRGQLSPERSQEVERHLVSCHPCAQRISSESLSMTAVPSIPGMGLPERASAVAPPEEGTLDLPETPARAPADTGKERKPSIELPSSRSARSAER